MKKRLLFLFLACISIFILGTITVSAAEVTEEGFHYVDNGSTIEIVGYSGTETEIVIPSEINGKPVTQIGFWSAFSLSGNENIKSVTIPDSVTEIASSSFYSWSNLENVIIGKNVEKIGDNSFYGCKRLTNIVIPDSVEIIGAGAFFDCSALTNVTLGKGLTSIGGYAFGCCNSLKAVFIKDLAAYLNCNGSAPLGYGVTLYLNGEKLSGDVTIPDGVMQIPENAFYNCDEITSITIPDGVISIGRSAFQRCSNLLNVTISKSVTNIGGSAFYQCTKLVRVYISDLAAYLNCEYGDFASNPMCYARRLYLNGKLVKGEIEIPEGITKIPDYAFCHQDITGVKIPDSVTEIGFGAFEESGMTSITIPGSVDTVSGRMFESCKALTDVTILDGVKTIENGAFQSCSSLKNIVLPQSVKTIRSGAFLACNSLIEIVLPDGITTLGDSEYISDVGVFHSCENLETVVLPDSLTTIGYRTFQRCKSLKTIILPESVQSIGAEAFCSSGLTSISIPLKMGLIESNAFNDCDGLETVYYDGTEEEWDEIYIEVGNDVLKKVTLKQAARIAIYDADGNKRTVTCEMGATLTLSDIETLYKHRVTLYTDSAMTKLFDLSTPITEKTTLYVKLGEKIVGATVNGQVTSYDPQVETVIQLMQDGAEKYHTTIAAETSGSGQETQTFSIAEVAAGTYDLVVTKAGHLTYTIQNVVVENTALDLTTNSSAAISTITLLAGDLNGDGFINAKDRTALYKELNKSGSDIDNILADMNGDHYVNAKDRTILTKNLNKSAVNDCTISY